MDDLLHLLRLSTYTNILTTLIDILDYVNDWKRSCEYFQLNIQLDFNIVE